LDHQCVGDRVEIASDPLGVGLGIRVPDDHAHTVAAIDLARELDPIADTLMIQPLGPVVGAHAGPGVVGVGCYPAELFRLGIKQASSARSRA
jgi:hypothetical protein